MNENTVDKKYFVFQLQGDKYVIPLERVTNIIELQKATRIPETPDYLEGIINLRGELIPLIDTRLKFGLPQGEFSYDTCILIIHVFAGQDDFQLALIVDKALDVMEISRENMEKVPDMGLNLNPDYVEKVANIKQEVYLILDIDKIFSTKEITLIKEISEHKNS